MQHKGVQAGRPLNTNKVAGAFSTTRQEAGAPADEQLRVSYGMIAEVDEDTSKVRVDLFNRGGRLVRLGAGHDGTKNGTFVAVMQPLQVIHMMYGSLRKGLIVRVFWRGKNSPASDAIVEIVSDVTGPEFLSGSKQPRSNELAIGPADIFAGGIQT